MELRGHLVHLWLSVDVGQMHLQTVEDQVRQTFNFKFDVLKEEVYLVLILNYQRNVIRVV